MVFTGRNLPGTFVIIWVPDLYSFRYRFFLCLAFFFYIHGFLLFFFNGLFDFPRIPFTPDFDLFIELSGLGKRLAAVHLMKSPELVRTFSKYEVMGSDLVDAPHFKPEAGGDGRVYINKTQYFSNISKQLWEFEVCGYQVLKKWLWDRKKRILTPGDIHHYVKICRAVQLTTRYCDDIDVFYSHVENTL